MESDFFRRILIGCPSTKDDDIIHISQLRPHFVFDNNHEHIDQKLKPIKPNENPLRNELTRSKPTWMNSDFFSSGIRAEKENCENSGEISEILLQPMKDFTKTQ